MPTICAFYGIVIRMFFNDYTPPHFHVQYGEFKAEISIETLEVRGGGLPRRALSLVLEWAAVHRAELLKDWELCRKHERPLPIAPLD